MNLLSIATTFFPDILGLYLILVGGKLESRAVRRRIRTSLEAGGAHAGSIDEEESLLRLYKYAKGMSSDFTAVAVLCVSLLLTLARLEKAWVLVMGSVLMVLLVLHIHLLWASTDLDRVDEHCMMQRRAALALFLLSVLIKLDLLLSGVWK